MRAGSIAAFVVLLVGCATAQPTGTASTAQVTCLPCQVSCVPGSACRPTTQAQRDNWESVVAGPVRVAVVAQERPAPVAKAEPPPPAPVKAEPPPPAPVVKEEPPPPAPAEAPTASPAPGTFTGTQQVTLSSATPGAAIHYTTDGSTPTASSPVYSGPIAVDGTTTVNAVAIAPGAPASSVFSGTYAVEQPPPPAPARVVVTREKLELKDKVFFDTGKATIKPVSYSLLDEVAAALKSHDEVKRVEVGGHTDSLGDAALNKSLSQQRAAAVRAYLLEKGVEPSRLEAKGYGEEKPIEPNTTPKGREANRRVEFSIGM
jgi:outer membrane protein OmpA-like peptidoglycan-associated protein